MCSCNVNTAFGEEGPLQSQKRYLSDVYVKLETAVPAALDTNMVLRAFQHIQVQWKHGHLCLKGHFAIFFCLRRRRLYGFLRTSWRRFLSLPFLSSVPVPPAVNRHFTREGLWKFWQLSKAVGYQKSLTQIWKFMQKCTNFSRRSYFQNHHLHGLDLTKICRWQISLLSTHDLDITGI